MWIYVTGEYSELYMLRDSRENREKTNLWPAPYLVVTGGGDLFAFKFKFCSSASLKVENTALLQTCVNHSQFFSLKTNSNNPQILLTYGVILWNFINFRRI